MTGRTAKFAGLLKDQLKPPDTQQTGAETLRFIGCQFRHQHGGPKMFNYACFYRGKKIVVQALRSYDAQEKAAKLFKARKSYEVAVVLADQPVSTASL